MPVDRRKNGRLRKYHYSKIRNAGDSVARSGVRDIGFKSGSLPHDPGGITCMQCCGFVCSVIVVSCMIILHLFTLKHKNFSTTVKLRWLELARNIGILIQSEPMIIDISLQVTWENEWVGYLFLRHISQLLAKSTLFLGY